MNPLIEGIDRKPASEIVELSVTEMNDLLLQARREGLNEIKKELPAIKQRARERGFNASQTIGCLDRLISWRIAETEKE